MSIENSRKRQTQHLRDRFYEIHSKYFTKFQVRNMTKKGFHMSDIQEKNNHIKITAKIRNVYKTFQ